MKRLILLGCIAVATGCTEGHLATNDSLARPVAVETGAVTHADVSFTIQGGFASATQVAMTIAKPQLKLHTSGDRAEIDALSLPLGDVTISAEALPPRGLVLRNLVVSAPAAKAEIMHAQNDALELRVTEPLSLDWSLQLDNGALYPLGTVHTAPINLDINVVRADGATLATVQAACLGTCWSVDGVAKLSDGSVYLEADAEVTAAK